MLHVSRSAQQNKYPGGLYNRYMCGVEELHPTRQPVCSTEQVPHKAGAPAYCTWRLCLFLRFCRVYVNLDFSFHLG